MGFSAFLSQGRDTLKVSTTKEWDNKILNNAMGETEYVLFHPETIQQMQTGTLPSEVRHFNLDSGVLSKSQVKCKVHQCAYDAGCLTCQLADNRESFKSAVFKYIEEELGITEKATDTEFYKAYNQFFLGIRSTNLVMKFLHMSNDVFTGKEMKTVLFRLSSGPFTKIGELVTKNESLFESGEILTHPLVIVTNGQSGKKRRYEKIELVRDEKQLKYMNQFLPDWSKANPDNAFSNFDTETLRPSDDPKKIKELIGEGVFYESFGELVDDIKKSIPLLHKGTGSGVQSSDNSSTGDALKSKFSIQNFDPSQKSESILEDSPVKETEDEAELANAVAQLANPTSPEETSSSSEDIIDDDEIVDDEEQSAEVVVLSPDQIKGRIGRKVLVEAFETVLKHKDALKLPNDLVQSLQSGCQDAEVTPKARTQLREFMAGQPLVVSA